jgi:geranylgeranyl diphosphate synthase type 3
MEKLNMNLNYNQSGILRQRPENAGLKKYFVTLLEKFGSLNYTRHSLEVLEAEVRAEVAKFGGNPMLEVVLDELLAWKRGTDEKHPEK